MQNRFIHLLKKYSYNLLHVFIIHLQVLAPILKTVFTTPILKTVKEALPKLGNKHISKQAFSI